MRLPLFPLTLALVALCFVSSEAQSKRRPANAEVRSGQLSTTRQPKALVVIDEMLSVLRKRPSLFADPIQRMRRGRVVKVVATADGDGVTFYKVNATGRVGWVQAEALFARDRTGDELRLARLVQATDGFQQIELAAVFLKMYPSSTFRPAILLLVGDLLEDAATKLSRDARSRLRSREMTASGAPIHSFYLNFNLLDRYRRIGVRFLFNPSSRSFHYDGSTWSEIVRKHPRSTEAAEAQKRLDSLQAKVGPVPGKA